jgi:biotin carboxyl carrier protein
MKKFKFTIEGKSFEVSVSEQDKNVAEVTVNGQPYTVEFERENAAADKPVVRKPVQKTVTAEAPVKKDTPPPPAAKKAGSENSVISPLPGNIFKILVTKGQAVKRGESLVVIESMKMENNITADRDGVVKAIHVQIGQSVLQGDALVDLE